MGIALFGLLRKELVQFFRDRLILTLILWLYTIEVVICAVALSFDVSHLPLAVVDEDRSALSRSTVALPPISTRRASAYPPSSTRARLASSALT